MNTFGSGNWMEMCQVIAPAACFALLESERGRESVRGGKVRRWRKVWRQKASDPEAPRNPFSGLRRGPPEYSLGHCCPAPANALCAR